MKTRHAHHPAANASYEESSLGSRWQKTRDWPADGGVKIRRILTPVDLSEPALEAFRYASAFGGKFGALIYFLTVIEPPSRLHDLQNIVLNVPEDIEEREVLRELAALVQAEVPPELPATPLVRRGKPAVEIVRATCSLRIDLIIMGTHGYRDLKHMLFGSTVEQMVREAPCAVLTIGHRKVQPASQQFRRQTGESAVAFGLSTLKVFEGGMSSR